MVCTPPKNVRQSLAKEDLSIDIARQEKKRKTATVMEEPSDGVHEKQQHGRSYGRRQTSLAFGNEQRALSCIDPNNKNNILYKNLKRYSLESGVSYLYAHLETMLTRVISQFIRVL